MAGPSKRRALLLGCNSEGLDHCERDAQRLQQALTRCGFHAETLLAVDIRQGCGAPLAGSNKGWSPKAVVSEAIETFLAGCQRGDTAVVYFSGHSRFAHNVFSLVIGENPGDNRHLLNVEALALLFKEHRKPAERLLILDCCEAEAAASDAFWSQAAGTWGRIWVAARTNEHTQELDGETNGGLFTALILRVLTHEAPRLADDDGCLRIGVADRFVRDETAKYRSKTGRPPPRPGLYGNTGHDILLAERLRVPPATGFSPVFERIEDVSGGSPVSDPAGQQVVAVVTRRSGENEGFASNAHGPELGYPEAKAWPKPTASQPKPAAHLSPSVARPIPDKFLVAFSFAGEQRELVQRMAVAVEARLRTGTVFLDDWFEHYLAGADADLKLQSIYGERSELVVVCVSERYGGKPWTLAEHEAIRARLMHARASADARDRDRILPIRVGDGDVEGILFNTIVPDVRDRTADATADLILARLALVAGDVDSSRGSVPLQGPSDTSSAIAQPPPTAEIEQSNAPAHTSKLSEVRRQALQQQLTLLTAQWEAALKESAMTSGAAQVRAAQQAEQLEQRIAEIERRLGGA
jgi:hypothetical protein